MPNVTVRPFTVTINGSEVHPLIVNGQRVLTLAMIDQIHQRPRGTARRNFNDNKQHLTEGEDFIVRNSYEAKEVGIRAPNGLTVVTESGYLLLVKSFTDELAWQIQKQLVQVYFRVRSDSPDADTISKAHAHQLLKIVTGVTHATHTALLDQLLELPSPLPCGTRLLVYLDHDRNPHVQLVPLSAVVLTWEDLPELLRDPAAMVESKNLVQIAGACLQTLTRRTAHA